MAWTTSAGARRLSRVDMRPAIARRQRQPVCLAMSGICRRLVRLLLSPLTANALTGARSRAARGRRTMSQSRLDLN
jgi:hypothetical protein